ncbi:MAG: metallophosphoesterase family protein [Halobacteriota archaeon]|nr:metallophosphoesterase family protein [Halobacteriota archaeon]
MRIGVVSDTHIPVRVKELPKELKSGLKDVDLILHAGDFEESSALRDLRDICEVKAVHGNMDSLALKEELPEKLVLEVEGYKIGLTHGFGAPEGLEARLRKRFDKIDIMVYGHSHRPMNEVVDGTLFFNPGSPTDIIFAPFKSFGILEIGREIRAEIIKI